MDEPILTRKKIYLRDTDATGVLYFTEQFRLALEVLEERFSLRNMLEKESFLFPIVHAAADYLAPLRVGDEVDIALHVAAVGTTSLTLSYTFFSKKRAVGKVTIVHVAISKKTGETIPIPAKILQQFKGA